MFNLTRQEQQVVLFLASVALVGLGINFALKVNSRIERLVKADTHIARININEASLRDLASAKVISAKLAERIIEYRKAQGPFQELEDLKKIKGIGDYRFEKLKDIFYAQ